MLKKTNWRVNGKDSAAEILGLKRSLDDLPDRAVEFTQVDMRELERELRTQGYTDVEAREQAWQKLRTKWILLPNEK